MKIRARHWLTALIVAGLAHGLLFLRYSDVSEPAAEDPGQRAVRISLAPEPAPKPQEEPEPEPDPEPPEPEPEPEPEPQPEPKPEPEPQPEPEPTPTAVPDPEPTPAPEATHQPEETEPPPAEQQAPETREGTTGGMADAPPDYRDRLRAWLERHKAYPRRARRLGQEGTVTLHFVMDREGRVLEWEIRGSSGHRLLDDAVTEMIERADPMPPMPADMPMNRLTLTVPINFRLH